MINWLKKKLGILRIMGEIAILRHDITRVEKKVRYLMGRKSQRYDEIERDRARRQKDR